MNQWSATVSQIQEFLNQHVPAEVVQRAGLGALGAIVGGVLLCVLGAKLARVGFTGAWALVGALVGYRVAQEAGMHPVPGALLFAAGIGVIGHLTYRFWVGVLTAGVITALVLGAFGYQRVGPRLQEYNERQSALLVAHTEASDEGAAFSIPTAEEQNGYRREPFRRHVSEFWGYVKTQDATVAGHAKALGLTALVFGLLVGLSTIRYTMILTTSLLGTALLGTGIVGGVNALWPGFAAAAANKPILNIVVFAVFMLISIFLQVRLTRAAKEDGETPPAKGKSAPL
ncbi:MAG: hypothetical protein KJ057_07400 [Phycisphaerae bacterium]|nr:MAG: hypothetical protein EDS66_04405 [Planctomycetota bacterium]KAB2939559.1 MAG: hypothetical protein F9K17_14935 [Phycisphaerae bacterium]MBE7457026.1 hypothetical protein [Planctomycetia bacterium]MCK6463616.1 hypothetical protein [Phycisphaerae bacterium]MCL4718284.1 hypothetical protein [Phycisphaerae bacterium]